MDTRPTSDRLRESIFNILAFQIHGRLVLDLFAGTGALGIEALSRGAESAVFIDRGARAISVIDKNITLCGLADRATVLKFDILKGLHRLRIMGKNFDLVFMDPPYNRNIIRPTLIQLHHSRTVKDGALLVIEHDEKEAIPEDLAAYELTDRRKYGKTGVSFLRYVKQVPSTY